MTHNFPIAIHARQTHTKQSLKRYRRWLQAGFFLLFVLAPILDIFRFDLNAGHFIFLGQAWTLQLGEFQQGHMPAPEAVRHILLYVFLPGLAVAGGLLFIAWRWGRLYCGWLCPHYSVVETINRLMLKASGKPDLWTAKPLPEKQSDGSIIKPDKRYWPLTLIIILLFALLWAVSLLTYLLPPTEIYGNLFSGNLTQNQSVFIAVATLLFSIEFSFARHLFCRYACAVGFFQSLSWMSNRQALVVAFDQQLAKQCKSCNNACDNQCPMRLKPRSLKRKMFNCTQCGECLVACEQTRSGKNPPLQWVSGKQAVKQSAPPVDFPVRRHD